jgi:TorA maturation chaperone TorD
LSEGLSLAERAPLYDFAARLLVSEVDAATWAAITAEPLRTLLDKAHPGFAAWAEGEWNDERREGLAEEFARLFLVPGLVPPFASRWLVTTIGDEAMREKTRGEIASIVALACEGLGLGAERRGPGGNLPADHAALIFAIAAEAATQPDAEDDPVLARFDETLLGPGWATMGGALVEHARVPLYAALGVLLRDLHEGDR